MADNTQQGGNDLIVTDEITEIDGVAQSSPFAKAQFIKPGYGLDGKLWTVNDNRGLPIDAATAALTTLTINALSAFPSGVGLDTAGYQWATVEVSAGYVGETSLTAQCSIDGVNWFSWQLINVTSTRTAMSSSLGITSAMFHGPIPGRYIRFNPAGAYTSGSQTVKVLLTSIPVMSQTLGVSAALDTIASNIAPAIATSPVTMATGTGNSFQYRVTGTIDQAATAITGFAVSGQFAYVTEIRCSTWGAAAGAAPTPRRFQLVAASSALIEHNLVCPPNETIERVFRTPWKVASASNIALNLAVTSMVAAAAGNWEIIVSGYYQTS